MEVVWSWSDKLIYLGLVLLIYQLLVFIVNLPDEGDDEDEEDN